MPTHRVWIAGILRHTYPSALIRIEKDATNVDKVTHTSPCMPPSHAFPLTSLSSSRTDKATAAKARAAFPEHACKRAEQVPLEIGEL